MRRNVVASLESLAILCTQILDQNLGSLASSLQHGSMFRNHPLIIYEENTVNKRAKLRLYYSGRLTSPLTLTMLSQEGAAVIMKGEGGVLSLLVFLHQLAVSIIGTLIIILHPLRFVVFQHNLNNLKDTIEKTELVNHLWLQSACKSDSLVVTK